MAVYVVKKALVFVKANPATFTAGDAIRVEEVTFNYPTAETNERPTGVASMGMGKTFIGGVEGSITLKFPLKGSGATSPHTAPEFGVLLKACHMAESGIGGVGTETEWDYEPSNGAVTLYDCLVQVTDQDGGNPMGVRIDKCVGNLVLEGARNGPMFGVVELRGVFAAPVNDVELGATGLDTTVAQNFKGTTVDMHGSADLVVDSYSFDMGNEIVIRPSLLDAQGFLSGLILSRRPSGTLDPEIVAISSFDPTAIMIAETQDQLDFGAIGGTTGNKVTITHPLAQIVGVSFGDRNGVLVSELTLHFGESLGATGGGADDIKIAFT